MSTAALQKAPTEQPLVVVGFDNSASFAHIQRVAQMFSQSMLVPETFRGEQGMPNCVIALEMANRMGASALAIMQNIYIVHGKPGWSAQFITSAVNTCGKFSPLRFTLERLGKKKVAYEYTVYVGREKERKKGEVEIEDVKCVAWALDLTPEGGNERLESPPVTIEMAVKEGWYTKTDSKWKTMPELMLRYRAATFFGRLYAPEILMGMKTDQELLDTLDVESEVVEPKPPVKLTRKAKPSDASDPLKPATSAETPSQSTQSGSPDTSSSATDAPELSESQQIIYDTLTGNGVSFEDARGWMESTGRIKDATSLSSWADIPNSVADPLSKDAKALSNCVKIFGKKTQQ